jgi:TolB-like protein
MAASQSSFETLKSRRVVRAAIAHVIVAWLFVQVADVVLPYLGVVDEPVRWALAISVGTFPLTLFIAWLSDEGRPVPELLVLVGVAIIAGWWVTGNLPEGARERTSIVVLPFTHDAVDEGLARALTYEVISLLTRTRAIDVISYQSANSSVLQGVGSVAAADRLSVQNVLQGSVRSRGETMSVDLQLLDAAGGVLWQATLDESRANLAALQARIARAVESRLAAGDEAIPVAVVAAQRCWMPTDPDALRDYYTARHYIEMRTGTPESRQQIAEAIAIYKRLLDAYPEFAEARAGLAWAYEFQFTYDRPNAIENFRQVASATAAAALEDCPTLGEALILAPNELGHTNGWITRWQQLTAATEMEPHKFESYQLLVRHYRDTGLEERALETAERLVSINPLSVRSLKELASINMHLGRYAESKALYEKSIELGNTAPNWAEGGEKLKQCREDGDIECILDNLYPPHQPYKDQLRVVYRTPLNDADAAESIRGAMQLFDTEPVIFTNWLNASACEFEHLTPLFFDVWQGSRERGAFWFWPNVWGDTCVDVHSSPQFPDLIRDVGLDEYWNKVGWPTWCQPQGETFACGRNLAAL